MDTKEKTITQAAPVFGSYYEKLSAHVASKQTDHFIDFNRDFKKLPKKVQFLIIRLVRSYNDTKAKGFTEYSLIYNEILTWMDCYCILHYSAFMIITYINKYYLNNQ